MVWLHFFNPQSISVGAEKYDPSLALILRCGCPSGSSRSLLFAGPCLLWGKLVICDCGSVIGVEVQFEPGDALEEKFETEIGADLREEVDPDQTVYPEFDVP